MDRQGFAWALLTAKKQAVPSPAATHRVQKYTEICASHPFVSSFLSCSGLTILKFCEAIKAFYCVKEKTVLEKYIERKVEGSECAGDEKEEKEYSSKVIGREFKRGSSKMSYYTLQPVSPSQ